MTKASFSCALVVVAMASTAGGCARPRPVADPARPPALEVPVVPPRVMAPLPETPEPEEPAAAAPGRPRPVRPAPRERPAASAPPDVPPEPTTPAEAAPRPAEPSPVLQRPQTADDAEAARRVGEVLSRAERDLGRVDRGRLGGDARLQFDTARRFIDQARGALGARNYVFATYLAEKAEALARGLIGR